MVTREAYDTVGGFRDVDQFEDLQFSLDVLIRYPGRVKYVPEAVVKTANRRFPTPESILDPGHLLDYRKAYRNGSVINV